MVPPEAAGDPLRPLLEALDAGTLLLLDRLDCGGALLLPLLARAALDSGHRVVVVAAAHSPARHAAALRKVGISQQQQQQSVAFVVADSGSDGEAKEVSAGSAAGATAPNTELGGEDASAARCGHAGGAQPECELLRLLRRLAASADALLSDLPPAPAQGLTLMLDSLPALLSLFPGGVQASAFLHSCRSLGVALRLWRYRFAVLAAADAPGEALQLAALQHACDAVMVLHPVEGRTANLDGRLDIVLRRTPRTRPGSLPGEQEGVAEFSAPGIRSWHFRIGDIAVRWLPDHINTKQLML